MMPSQSRPWIANPTTARIAQTTKRITITVSMPVTVPAYGRGNDGCGMLRSAGDAKGETAMMNRELDRGY